MSLFRYFVLLGFVMNLQGCFYQVERGKGGVAERFDTNVRLQETPYRQSLLERINQSEKELNEAYLHRNTTRFPALYWETHMRLNESQRLFEAAFYQQSDAALKTVENVLNLIQQSQHQKAFDVLCKELPYREVCL